MTTLKNILSDFFILLLIPVLSFSQSNNEVLWYNSPARYWNSQALHIGNGFMGASFFGGVNTEELALSEKSFWTGSPVDGDWEKSGFNPRSKESLPQIQKLIKEGKIEEADALVKKDFLGRNTHFGELTAIGSLRLIFKTDTSNIENYKRSLDLSNALGQVSFTAGGTTFKREYLCSYPDKVLAIKLTADKKKSISFLLGLSILQDSSITTVKENELEVQGRINGNHRPFHIRIKVLQKGGSIRKGKNTIEITGANEAVLLVSVATNYKLHYPDYKIDENPATLTQRNIELASALGFDKIKAKHMADYRELYDRVKLNIEGNPIVEKQPTDMRWKQYRAGNADPGFKVLAFNLGRYLVISSSRPGTLPAHLQGNWNVFMKAPWSGNYQSNINLQMIYWSCGSTALQECQTAYIDWIRDLVVPGREVARRCYGTDGWVSNATGNIWGHAAPSGGLSFALYPVGSAWHCLYVWEQFAFSTDTAYLRNIAYPILKEACLFYAQNLTEYMGHLMLAPSVSAEHGAFQTADGLRASSASNGKGYVFTMPAPTQDATMLWDIFTNTIEAASILKCDEEFRQLLTQKRDSLFPLKIGRMGQLQEWAWDIDNPDCRHRHIGHLYGVYPGRQIDPLRDTALARAAAIALDLRKEGRFPDDVPSGGNWSTAHRMWCRARLLDGEGANRVFTRLIKEQSFENLLTYQHHGYHFVDGKNLYKENDSLFCHFQLDASASVPGLMAEMLLQSHLGELHLLPALPAEFKTGSVKGLRARGGYVVNIEWKDGNLVKAEIFSSGKTKPVVRVNKVLVDTGKDKRIQVSLGNNK